jgi:hypothetical protein
MYPNMLHFSNINGYMDGAPTHITYTIHDPISGEIKWNRFEFSPEYSCLYQPIEWGLVMVNIHHGEVAGDPYDVLNLILPESLWEQELPTFKAGNSFRFSPLPDMVRNHNILMAQPPMKLEGNLITNIRGEQEELNPEMMEQFPTEEILLQISRLCEILHFAGYDAKDLIDQITKKNETIFSLADALGIAEEEPPKAEAVFEDLKTFAREHVAEIYHPDFL